MAGIRFEPQIRFEMQGQQGQYLCWIAVAVSVAAHFNAGSTLQQCQLAGKLPHGGPHAGHSPPGTCCGASLANGPCDNTGRLDVALGAAPGVNHLNGVMGRMKFEQVKAEIDNRLPVCAYISFFGERAGHFILISGYNVVNGVQYLYVNDPQNQDGVHPYDEVATNYRFVGSWQNSYKLKKA
jgi:hypothetical protein